MYILYYLGGKIIILKFICLWKKNDFLLWNNNFIDSFLLDFVVCGCFMFDVCVCYLLLGLDCGYIFCI